MLKNINIKQRNNVVSSISTMGDGKIILIFIKTASLLYKNKLVSWVVYLSQKFELILL